MKKILNVPYYSQYRDVKDEYWKPRACGAICLKMVLDFLKQPQSLSMNVEEFVKLANERGAYGEGGWVHQGLVDTAKEFGVKMKRREFKKNPKIRTNAVFLSEENIAKLKEGIKEILLSLKNKKPVLVSAIKRWEEKEKFHMVVLTGFEVDEGGEVKGFYYNDTDYQSEKEGKDLFVGIEIFKKYWRRLVIFVDKN